VQADVAGTAAAAPAHDRRFQASKALLGAASTAAGAFSGNSLAALVAAERSGGHDMDRTFASNIRRLGARYKGTDVKSGGAFGGGDNNGYDEEDDVDDKLFEQRNQLDEARASVARAMLDQQRHESAVSRCSLCRCAKGETAADSHLRIYMGQHIGVRLKPGNLRMGNGHCEVFSRSHTESTLKLEEECWEELSLVKAALRRMHASEGRVACFVEVAIGFSRTPHGVLECVPVEAGMEAELQYSVQEAFTEVNGKFAQNSKIFRLTAEKPLHRCIPPHFEYAAAEWGSAGAGKDSKTAVLGLAHVVQAESGTEPIQSDFLLDVLAGLLDEDPMRMRKKIKPDVAADTREATRVRAAFSRFLS